MHWFILNRKPFYLPADLTPHSYILAVDEAVNILEGIKMYRTPCNKSPCDRAPLRDSKRIFPELVQMPFFPPVSTQNRYQQLCTLPAEKKVKRLFSFLTYLQ